MAGEIKNVEIEVKGDKLTIVIDLTKDFGLTSTEKSFTVASTGGFVGITHGKVPGLKLNLNVIKPAKK